MGLLDALQGLLLLIPMGALLIPLMKRMDENKTQKVRVRIDDNEHER